MLAMKARTEHRARMITASSYVVVDDRIAKQLGLLMSVTKI